MTEKDSFIDEVTEEVRRDKLYLFFRRYGWILFIFAFLIVGTIGWVEFTKNKNVLKAQKLGDAISNAQKIAKNGDLAALDLLANGKKPGSIIPMFMNAYFLEEKNKYVEAFAQYKRIFEDDEIATLYRELAKLKGYFLLDYNDEKAVTLLNELISPDGIFSLVALEQRAFLNISANRLEEAKEDLDSIILNPKASKPLINRVNELKRALGRIGK